MRVELPRRSRRLARLLIAVAFCVVFVYVPGGHKASAQTPTLTPPPTKLVIYADHRMPDAEWAALFSALRRQLTNSADGSPLAGEAVLIRGEVDAGGVPVTNGIGDGVTVYIQGDCTLRLPPLNAPHAVTGALGWVARVNGQIEPYIHVDCSTLVKVLGRTGMQTSREGREGVMGEAMARVIVHEWIHYTTQSAAHADRGISKPEFNTLDLLADDSELYSHKRMRHQEKARGF